MLHSAFDSGSGHPAYPLVDEGCRPAKRARNWPPSDQDPNLGFQAVDSSTSSEMPKTVRHDLTVAQRPQEKEKIRLLSCKECRRLKLKCDRVFPCQSCKKRGCGDICPEGVLTSGRGSRFILANTEQLHAKISVLSDRVRQLEDGLRDMQITRSNEPHPLLVPELLQIKTTQEFYGIPQSMHSSQRVHALRSYREESLRESVSTLSLNNTREEGPSNRNTRPEPVDGLNGAARESSPPEIPQDILRLSATFPFPWSVDLRIRARIRDALPAQEEAIVVCEEARQNALWQYNLDASKTFLTNLLHHCYTLPIEDVSPRRLALLLMILSIGSLVDLNRPLGSLYGEAYHHLARASVCEIPLMEEPDFDTLHALFFMIWYHLIFSDNKKAVGYAWNLMGFVAKLAQGLGLHSEVSRAKEIPEEHEKRRFIFWELLNMDCRMSLSLGRPPSICLAHVNVKPPSYVGQGLYVPTEEILYHQWKNSFFIQCLSPILEAIIAAEPPEYNTFIALDAKVRDFRVPELLDTQSTVVTSSRFLIMQRALVSMGLDIALLQLHRRHFTEAMSSPETFDFQHRYAPSVVATYMSASSLISVVDALFDQEGRLSARFLCFWFNAFSAAVTLSLLVSRAPSCPIAPCALQDLERVCGLFRRAAKVLPFSGKTLPVIEKMLEKSRRIYLQWCTQVDGYTMLQSAYTVPAPFVNVHHLISQSLERIKCSSVVPVIPAPVPPSGMQQLRALSPEYEGWLPDIYHFKSIDVMDKFASAPPTPFVPSSPRVGEQESMNFDHGALKTMLEDTSYMAWF